MWDDKYGPNSLYAQIEEQKARAIRENAEAEANMRRHAQWQLDQMSKQSALGTSSGTNDNNTGKKTGWFL